ncbi:NUDIX hydrolase [Microbacterium lacusdiani]
MNAPEMWDLRDGDGRPTGARVRRGDVLPEGTTHLVAATCVLRADGRVLLTRRAASKAEHPLTWEFPGGSALAGESSAQAASRELHEETGILAPPSQLTFIGRHREISAFVDLYAVSLGVDVPVVLDPAEVAAAEWVSFDEIFRRRQQETFAEPWLDRLDALLQALARWARSNAPHPHLEEISTISDG